MTSVSRANAAVAEVRITAMAIARSVSFVRKLTTDCEVARMRTPRILDNGSPTRCARYDSQISRAWSKFTPISLQRVSAYRRSENFLFLMPTLPMRTSGFRGIRGHQSLDNGPWSNNVADDEEKNPILYFLGALLHGTAHEHAGNDTSPRDMSVLWKMRTPDRTLR